MYSACALFVGGDSGVLTICTPCRGGTEVCVVSVTHAQAVRQG